MPLSTGLYLATTGFYLSLSALAKTQMTLSQDHKYNQRSLKSGSAPQSLRLLVLCSTQGSLPPSGDFLWTRFQHSGGPELREQTQQHKKSLRKFYQFPGAEGRTGEEASQAAEVKGFHTAI